MNDAPGVQPSSPTVRSSPDRGRSVGAAVALMREALALLDGSGETLASIALSDAIVRLAGDPLGGADEEAIVEALDRLRASPDARGDDGGRRF